MLCKNCLGLVALGLFAFCAPAWAEETQPFPSVSDSAGLSDTELAPMRGGHTIVVANQTQTSGIVGDFIGDVTSGDVSISENALSSFNGLGNIVINTGSQVSLQAGMNVTINVSQ